MASERRATARGIAALPFLLMAAVHMTVTPLRKMFEVEPLLMYGWYVVALGLGLILFRRTRTVKDHEFHRSKVMKSMKKVYDAEEAGVWQTEVALDSEMGPVAKALLSKNVSAIDNETPEMELHEDEKVEVDLLLDSERIRKSGRRVSGDVNFDDESVDSTIGSTRKKNPMDSFLDWIFGIFGNGDVNQQRNEKRLAALQAASKASPVEAQRPVAPLRKIASSSDSELKISTLSDDGVIDSVVTNEPAPLIDPNSNDAEAAKVYSWDSPAISSQQQSDDSIESMAMFGVSDVRSATPVQAIATPAGTQCRGCNASIPQGEPFCLICGLDA